MYDWFSRCSIRFTPQIPLNASEILGNNGATLDGKLELGGAYFDVKAFGFNAALAELLREKIQQNFPDKYVSINDSLDISIDDFGNLLQNVHIICEKLNKDGIYRLGPLRVHMTEKQVVNISSRGSSPYLLAKENALFAFKDANQFVTNAPFALIYVSHPWYSPGGIGDDFAHQDTIFTRSFARRAFIQFSQDQRSIGEICGKADASQTLGTASRLLSAIFFFNAWPREADKNQVKKLQTWAYFNPRAKHPFPRRIIGALRADNIHGLHVDDFVDDNY